MTLSNAARPQSTIILLDCDLPVDETTPIRKRPVDPERKELQRLLRKARRTISQGLGRRDNQAGILIKRIDLGQGPILEIVSTDGFRLVRIFGAQSIAARLPEGFSATLSDLPADGRAKGRSDLAEFLRAKKIGFVDHCPGMTRGRYGEGVYDDFAPVPILDLNTFPDYRQVIPTGLADTLVLDKTALRKACDVAILATEIKNSALEVEATLHGGEARRGEAIITLCVNNRCQVLSAGVPNGAFVPSINPDLAEHGDIPLGATRRSSDDKGHRSEAIALNAHYLLDAVKVCDNLPTKITIKLYAPLCPVVITDGECETTLMPMRL